VRSSFRSTRCARCTTPTIRGYGEDILDKVLRGNAQRFLAGLRSA
jgi:hypothetical protein